MFAINSPQTEFDFAMNRFTGTEDWSRRFYSQAREKFQHMYTLLMNILYMCIRVLHERF